MVESSEKYEVPFLYRKHFKTEECTQLITTFKGYDKDGNGKMDVKEFMGALKDMGHDEVSEEMAQALLSRFDTDKSGFIEWVEFLDIMKQVKVKGKKSGADFITQEIKGVGAGHAITGASGTVSVYLDEEVSSFARCINNELKDCELVKERLPINPENTDLFDAMSDGLVGLHLLNKCCKPDPVTKKVDEIIDFRTVNKGANLNIYKVRENLDQFFAGCTGLIKVVGIDGTSFLDKNYSHILAITWQIVRIINTKSINLKDCENLFHLLKDGEEISDLQKLSVEEILKRWMNWHLRNAGQPEINNLGKDLQDSKSVLYVLNQLDKEKCGLEALTEEDNVTRAQKCIDNSFALGCDDVIGAKDLCKGNSKVNSLFVAEIFNTKHGLPDLNEEEKEAVETAVNDYDDIEGSREERAFRLWINSLGIEGVFINNLYEDVRDGMVLCKVIHRINDQVVEWNRIEKEPNNVFKKGINCQVAHDAAAKLKVQMVGIGAEDIRDGNKKLVLAIVWQLCRLHYLQIIGSKTENDLIAWVNAIEPIKDFKDSKFADGQLLIKLCATIEPQIINWDLVGKSGSAEDAEQNCKYAISIARKLGAIIFMVWDDIPALNKKMILIFVCSLYDMKHNIE